MKYDYVSPRIGIHTGKANGYEYAFHLEKGDYISINDSNGNKYKILKIKEIIQNNKREAFVLTVVRVLTFERNNVILSKKKQKFLLHASDRVIKYWFYGVDPDK